jgi:hypothetical protein
MTTPISLLEQILVQAKEIEQAIRNHEIVPAVPVTIERVEDVSALEADVNAVNYIIQFDV